MTSTPDYTDLPQKAAGLGDLLSFAQWLQSCGCIPLDEDDPYVTAAWRRLDGHTARIFHDRNGRLTWTSGAAEDFRLYLISQCPAKANDEPLKPEVEPFRPPLAIVRADKES